MQQKLTQFVDIVQQGSGGRQRRRLHRRRRRPIPASSSSSLKPLVRAQDRRPTQVIARLRRELGQVAGAALFLQSVQDIRVGGRQSNAQYQYTLQGDNLDELYDWAPKIAEALQHVPELTDVNSDQQQKGLETDLDDRPRDARRGSASRASQIDNTLYDAFGQRQVSTIYNALNQYHVVMEVAPRVLAEPGDAEGHLCQHRRRRGQRHAGDQRGGRHDRGDRRRSTRAATAARSPTTRRATSDQRARQHRPRRRLDRRRGQHQRRDDGAARRPSATSARATRRSRSTTRACSSPRRSRSTCAPGVSLSEATAAIDADDERHRRAGVDPRQLPGHGAGLPGIARQRAAPDPRRAGRGLHRARRSLRELRPSDHDPVDAAVGRRRRGAGADDRATPSSASSR